MNCGSGHTRFQKMGKFLLFRAPTGSRLLPESSLLSAPQPTLKALTCGDDVALEEWARRARWRVNGNRYIRSPGDEKRTLNEMMT